MLSERQVVSLDPATIAALVDLGVKLATTEIERRSAKRLADMNAAEVLQHVKELTAAFHAKTMEELEEENSK